MLKGNFKKKKAQHIVEFALIIPIFIMAFSIIFPIMTETYVHFRFSYYLINLVKQGIQQQPVFTTKEEAEGYVFVDELNTMAQNTDMPPLYITSIETPQTDFIIGSINMPIKTLFGVVGKNYFYFTVPIGASYTAPTVLNITEGNLNQIMQDYYGTLPAPAAAAAENENAEGALEG